jgi:hypothetical protein
MKIRSPRDTDPSRSHYDSLRSELIAAASRTERLVEASEELFEARMQFREQFRERSFTAPIRPALGSVTVTGAGELSIDLRHAEAATSDVARLGARILTALAEAEQEMRSAAAHGRAD